VLPPDQREAIADTAIALVAAYDKKLAINERSLQLLKKLATNGNTVALSDQLSTILVESGEVWNEVIRPVGMSMLMLIDQRATDENGNFIETSESNPGYVKRLVITKAEKEEFLDWFNKHFPELNDGTPKDKLSEPAETATLYLTAFKGRLCSDEPASLAGNSAMGNQR